MLWLSPYIYYTTEAFLTKPSHSEENKTITKILQEVQLIKGTILQTQGLAHQQGQSWAKIASKSEVAGTTIRIQDKNEKKEIAKLSSEELVKKIGMKEIIGARQMVDGQIKVYYAKQSTKQIMEGQKNWTKKLSTTAHIVSVNYQVLVHDMPYTFQPENPEHIKELQKANEIHLPVNSI